MVPREIVIQVLEFQTNNRNSRTCTGRRAIGSSLTTGRRDRQDKHQEKESMVGAAGFESPSLRVRIEVHHERQCRHGLHCPLHFGFCRGMITAITGIQ